MTLRVVFDTNVVLSALRARADGLAWLRGHWAARAAHALGSKDVVAELIRALAYPKFQLTPQEIQDLLADYLPYLEVVEMAPPPAGPRCRDRDDQKFVDLAVAGRADILVTGDKDLLAMKADASFAIETRAEYGKRFNAPTTSAGNR